MSNLSIDYPHRSLKGKTIAIKLPPYLKQYLIFTLGKEPIKINESSRLYMVLIQYLVICPKNWTLPDSSDNILHLTLPYNKLINKWKLGYFSEESMREIKRYVFILFYSQFIKYMHEKVNQERWKAKYAIINFIDTHDMQYTVTNYETLKKIYNRHKGQTSRIPKNLNICREKKGSVLSSICP